MSAINDWLFLTRDVIAGYNFGGNVYKMITQDINKNYENQDDMQEEKWRGSRIGMWNAISGAWDY